MARAAASPAVEIDPLHPRLTGQHGFDLKGHHDLVAKITEPGKTRRHHGFILTGAKGVGKATSAYMIAEQLFSAPVAGLFGDAPQASNPDDPDVKLVRAGSHPDLMVVEADESKATAAISVDQIRSVIPFLSHTPSRGGWRVVIIDALDEMNDNGANALLKTLEEPPEKAIILLLHHGTRPILPTIRSRAQMINFAPLNYDDTRQVISRRFIEADPSWVDVAAVLSDGAPGKAALLATSGVVDLYAETCQAFSKGNLSALELDQLSSQWGAGGAKNAARRQLARLMLDRLLTRAARYAVSGSSEAIAASAQPMPRMDIEEDAISTLAKRHSANHLAELHANILTDLNYAERVNLDMAHVIYQAFEKLR